MILALALLPLTLSQVTHVDPPDDPTVRRAAKLFGAQVPSEEDWRAASQRDATASAVLEIHDVRDLVEYGPAECAFYLPRAADSQTPAADPAAAILAQDAARTRALDRLEDHFRRFVESFDAAKDRGTSVQRAQGALIVRATPWAHEYIGAVLAEVRRRKESPRMPIMRSVAFEIDAAFARERGLEDSPVQFVIEPERKDFWRERLFPERTSAGMDDDRLRIRPGIQTDLGLLIDCGVRGDSIEPYRRFVTGYDKVEGIWPDARTVFVPRVKTVEFPTARFSGIPLPGGSFEVEMEFDSVAVIGVAEGRDEGGPISDPTLEEFRFESRLVMQPDQWVFAMIEGGARWKMVAIWMAPRD